VTRVWCHNELSWSCDGIVCDLPFDHEGDHQCKGDDGSAQRNDGRKDALVFRPVSYEIRWREKQP
jgi:hypothetical protein